MRCNNGVIRSNDDDDDNRDRNISCSRCVARIMCAVEFPIQKMVVVVVVVVATDEAMSDNTNCVFPDAGGPDICVI